MDVDLIYILLEKKPQKRLILKGETFKYLIKVRRHNVGDLINFRAKADMQILYSYKIASIGNRSLELEYNSSIPHAVKAHKYLHIGWCVIDSKSIEKVLPLLSETGVSKISFIYCERSQKSFKLDFKRYKRLLEASMQQSGRSTYIEFDTFKNIEEFIEHNPNTKVFDFCENSLKDSSDIKTVLIGCEGGFSNAEREFLKTQEVFRLDTPMVLRSESAVVAVAGKVLL